MLEKDTSVITYSRVCAIHYATVNQLPVRHLYATLTRDIRQTGLNVNEITLQQCTCNEQCKKLVLIRYTNTWHYCSQPSSNLFIRSKRYVASDCWPFKRLTSKPSSVPFL